LYQPIAILKKGEAYAVEGSVDRALVLMKQFKPACQVQVAYFLGRIERVRAEQVEINRATMTDLQGQSRTAGQIKSGTQVVSNHFFEHLPLLGRKDV